MQIGAQDRAKREEREADPQTFKTALTAELLAFSPSIIEATSTWNGRASETSAGIPKVWPTLMQPRVYEALLPKVGLLDGWVTSALISFYGQVLDLNELSAEAMRERPTSAEDYSTLATRFQAMAKYLADALDGLNQDRQFQITRRDLPLLRIPSGSTIGSWAQPKTLQELLYTLAGDGLSYSTRQRKKTIG